MVRNASEAVSSQMHADLSARAQCVFIAGCGRSGTSYLRTILDAHPDIYIPSESLFIGDYLAYEPYVPSPILRRLFFGEPQLKCWYEGDRFDFSDANYAIARVHTEMMERSGARIWGQKTPRLIRHMDSIQRAFPACKWILIYRDPRGVVASMLNSGQHTNSVWHACERWLRDNRVIANFVERESVPDNVRVVKYEDLVTDFDRVSMELFRFVGVSPISRAQIAENAKPVFFSRSRFKINTIRGGLLPEPDKLESWRAALTRYEVRLIESRCGPLMEQLGYQRESANQVAPSRGSVKNRLKDVIIALRYAWFWPEYPAYVLMRQLVFNCFYLLRRRRGEA